MGVSNWAQVFGVSKHCLLLQLWRSCRDSFERHINCVFAISESEGLPNSRGFRKPRLSLCLCPYRVGGFRVDQLYPGMNIERLGDPVCSKLLSILHGSVASRRGDITLTLNRQPPKREGTLLLKGWYQVLNGEHSNKTIMVWGQLQGA